MIDFSQVALWFIPVLLSLAVHEWAHAASAYALGDDTAAREGRLTLNPIAHMDPVGTILMPVLQVLSTGSVFFAWAKPVPFSPVRFDRRISMAKGTAIVAGAGPASNLLIAVGAAVGLGMALRFDYTSPVLFTFLESMFRLNVALAVFNMLPLPPLDGSKVLHGLLPRNASLAYEKIFPYAPALLIGIFLFGGRFLRMPMQLVTGWMAGIISAIAG